MASPELPTASSATPAEFHYQKVQLFKAKPLGVGSYGSVCKAQIDELPCAAKILHPMLFRFNDPGALPFVQRFEQECRFLKAVKHPHVVQYLGIYQDPDTGLPVLLMELMDESLTHFLERSHHPLPFHIEVNLSHDIALAIAYLHSIHIVHRDLSSNNVLLMAGSRAKVTDFGMCKLIDENTNATRLTQCPGTVVYMSPEALMLSMYSEKLDCFSLGVNIIQILCRHFPNPSPATRMVKDSRSPVGQVPLPVPESERRRLHISMITPTHPLLSIALRCLEYDEKDRPSSQELSHRIGTIKESPLYAQSVQQQRQPKIKQEEVSPDVVQQLLQQIEEKDHQLRTQDQQLQEKGDMIMALQMETQELREELKMKDRIIETRESQLQELHSQQQPSKQELYSMPMLSMFEQERIEDQLGQEVGEFLDLESDTNVHTDSTRVDSTSVDNAHVDPTPVAPAQKHDDNQAGQNSANTLITTDTLLWKECKEPPKCIYYTQPAVDGDTAYFCADQSLLSYDFQKEKWLELPHCPHYNAALVVVKGLLTAVGGVTEINVSAVATNKLLSLTGTWIFRKWSPYFPPMPTGCCGAIAVSTKNHLVVAGGGMNIGHAQSTIAVMDINMWQWSAAESLPLPLCLASAAVCGDNIYLLGGYDGMGSSKAVITCSTNALIQSCQTTGGSDGIWQRVADAPVYLSCCGSLNGQLHAFGGKDYNRQTDTTAVHMYEPTTNSWHIAHRMPLACSETAVAVLEGDGVVVASGWNVQTAIKFSYVSN